MTTEVTARQPAAATAPAPAPARAGSPPAVSTAIVLATSPGGDGEAAALLAWEGTTVLRRLVDQALSVGAEAVHVVTRPRWAAAVDRAVQGRATVERSDDASGDLLAIARIAAANEGGLLVMHGEVVTQREALAGLAADPRVATGVLTTVGPVGRPFAYRTRSARGRVVSAASPYHAVSDANTTFLGVLKVADAHRAALADAAARMGALTERPLPEGWEEELEHTTGAWRAVLASPTWRREVDAESFADAELYDEPGLRDPPAPERPQDIVLSAEEDAEVGRRAATAPDDVAALLLVALVRAGVPVGMSHLRDLFWARPLTAAEVDRARAEIGAHDEEKVLLDSSVKLVDGFFTTFFVSPWSKYVARWAGRRGLTPNQVTTASMLVAVAAAAAFATGDRWGLVAGAVLLQVSFAADCVDGQLARYTRQFSAFGAWLDSVFDRAKEYAVFAGLAIGYAATHGDDVWALAAAALTLQTVRHMFDFSFATAREEAIGETWQPPLEQPGDRPATGGAPDRRAETAAPPPSASLPRRVLVLWRTLDRRPGLVWMKRMAAFPVGERLALISITAALWDAKVTFVALLAWALFAAAYTGAGRVLRSVSR